MGLLETTLEINAPVQACFDQWMCMECLPRIFSLVEKAEVREHEIRWHWRMTDPTSGHKISWATLVDTVEPNRVISWHSLDGAPVDASGALQFEALGDRARLHAEMMFTPPVGSSEFVHDYFSRQIEQLVLKELTRFQQMMEAEPIQHVLVPVEGAGEVHEKYRNLTPLSIRTHEGAAHEIRTDPAV